MNHNPQKILVCPLDWGLGHATRMIPLVQRLMESGNTVIIGGSGRSGDLMRATFPALHYITIPSPVITYSRSRYSMSTFCWQLPRMVVSVFREHRMIEQVVKQHAVSVVISDNRYGLFCQSAYSVIVTHQVSPVLPLLLRWLEYPLYRLIAYFIKQYDECWIPDRGDPEFNFAGNLAHRYRLPGNARYIGILSRFENRLVELNNKQEGRYDRVVVLSGPEPQVSIFEKVIRQQLKGLHGTTLVITGLRSGADRKALSEEPGITTVSHLPVNEFRNVLEKAGLIICRSGYSSIMDLAVLGKSALLVPTPGQCEQEYLAGYLGRKGWFNWVPQDKLKLEELISKTLSHPIDLFTGNELDEAISGLYSNQKNYKGRKVADKKACIYL